MIDALSSDFDVIAIDYPSHGCSDHITGQPTIRDYAECVREVADDLGIKRLSLMGEATGAGVAVEFAGAFPDRVERLILVNCPVVTETVDDLLKPFKSSYRPSDASGFPIVRTLDYVLENNPQHSPIAPTQYWMDRINVAQIECGRERWQALTAIAQYRMIEGLGRVSCPVLLLVGEFFYFKHRVPMILEAAADIRWRQLDGARLCATWERAAEIATETKAFHKT
jgi:pimeloyl-ACP methyl ester carboxylesterase